MIIPFHRLVSLSVIGMFFNNFIPSSFGGEVVHAYDLGKQIASQAQSLASAFLERLTGLVALVMLAVVG